MCPTCLLILLVVFIGLFLALQMRTNQRIFKTFDVLGSLRFVSSQSSDRIYTSSAIAEPLLFLSSKHVPISNKRLTQTDAMHQVEGMGDGRTRSSFFPHNEFACLQDGLFGLFHS